MALLSLTRLVLCRVSGWPFSSLLFLHERKEKEEPFLRRNKRLKLR